LQASVSEKEQLPAEPNSNRLNWSGIGLLLLTNLIALSFLYSPGTGDVAIWRTWIDQMSAFGLVGGFVHSGTKRIGPKCGFDLSEVDDVAFELGYIAQAVKQKLCIMIAFRHLNEESIKGKIKLEEKPP